jgi:pyruvate,water dikinase
MIGFIISNMNLGKRFQKKIRIIAEETDRLKDALENFDVQDYHSVYSEIDELAREAAYYNIIVPLSMQITSAMLKRQMKKKGQEYHTLDFSVYFPELRSYDPQHSISALREKWSELPEQYQSFFSNYDNLMTIPSESKLLDFKNGMLELIEKFGHLSESGNDFSFPPWREDPDFVMDMVRKDMPAETSITESEETKKNSFKPGRKYRRAGRYRLYREMISSEYTRCYGLFRELFLKTGTHLTNKKLLNEPEDVFYLTLEEHNKLFNTKSKALSNELKEKARRIRKEMEDYKDIALPSVIYGEVPPPLPNPEKTMFQGIPASPGIFEGKIVVIRGYKDFGKIADGQILIIPFSDVGWTPILLRAGAIVSESGGMLSHASIIARELSIPAVASVDHACNLKDGIFGRVDGFNGILSIDK